MIAGPMKNVNRVKGRDGVERLYYRKAKQASVRLQSPWGSPGLEAEVAALAALDAEKATPGTLQGAIRVYELESADYRALAPSTKYLYRKTYEELNTDFGALPLTTFKPAYLLKLRDIWARRGHRACNIRLQVLKNILRPHFIAANEGDPFALIKGAPRPFDLGEPHVIWPESVVVEVINEAVAQSKYGIARAVALARYQGPRRGDLVKIPKSARSDGKIRFLSGKRKVQVDNDEDAALAFWLARIPDSQPNDARRGRKGDPKVARLPATTIVFNLQNGRYTEDGLGLELAKIIGDLSAAGRVDRDDYNLHGLRHTRGVELALLGVTDAQGAAAMGHASPASFVQYRRQADRIRLAEGASALVALFRERTANADLQNDVQKSCKTPLIFSPRKMPKS